METSRSVTRMCRLCGAILRGDGNQCWFCHRPLAPADILIAEKKARLGSKSRPAVHFPLPGPNSSPRGPLHEPNTFPHGIVYLLKAGPYYKIGMTKDFANRLDQIKLQLPFPVEVIHKIETDDPHGIETYWHKRFSDKRTNGEWFVLSNADVAAFISRPAR